MLIGREGECAAIDRLLDEAGHGRSGALVIRGEAGIGKSALLEYAVARAGDARIVRALGVETESEFAFSGLHELVRPLFDRLGELPPVQAAALRGALALAEAQGVGRLYVGAATLSLLAAAADAGRLLCVIDDAHWLDHASADALTFAARRLEAEGVVLLFAARGGEPAFRTTGIPELELTGLPAEAAAALFDQPVSTSVAGELVAATAGNPLALLDLARRLTHAQLTGAEPLPHPLPVADDLEAAFAKLAAPLSEDAKRALVIAATADTRAMRVIARTGGTIRTAIEECEDAGLLAIVDGQVSFSHPLVRSSVYQQASPAERRDAHRVLADAFAVDERYAERRAWHAAAAIVEPDEDIARELELAADSARERRGHVAAAAMFERAARLTPEQEPRSRRLYLAARSAWLAGQPDRALALLGDPAADELVFADQQLLRARIELRRGAGVATADLVAAAAAVERLDPARAASLLAAAAEAADPGSRLELAQRAAALADGSSAALIANLVLARVLGEAGKTTDAAARLERAKTALVDDPDLRHDPELILAAVETIASVDPGDDVLVRELVEVATSAARGHAVVVLPRALLHAAWLDFQAGRWRDAYLSFAESSRLADETGQGRERVAAVAGSALLDALQGREADARAGAAVLAEAPGFGAGAAGGGASRILGLLELGEGRGELASPHLEHAAANPAPTILLRGLPAVHVDLTEAYLRAGRREEAAAAAGRLGDPWAGALLGDRSAFAEAARRAAATPFLVARVRLNHGERLRRDGERRKARDELRAALELFEHLGANPWAERARGELRASGDHARKRRPSTADDLTPQELQIARMVAAGASYKEAAAKLFLSPKTIEFHLSKVYRKLEINSGRQLAQRLAEEGLA